MKYYSKTPVMDANSQTQKAVKLPEQKKTLREAPGHVLNIEKDSPWKTALITITFSITQLNAALRNLNSGLTPELEH